MAKSRRIPDVKRYWPKVDKRGANECWPWLGSTLNSGGYGQFYLHDNRNSNGLRTYAAHRYGYELAYGPIPKGKSVLHTCDNKICQNPRHLRLALARTRSERALRCTRGHLLTPDNTITNAAGAKICKACNRERQQEYRERNRMATVVHTPIPRRPVHLAY